MGETHVQCSHKDLTAEGHINFNDIGSTSN